MENTYEAQASVKNGVSRMIFAVISILLEVAVILLLLYRQDHRGLVLRRLGAH